MQSGIFAIALLGSICLPPFVTSTLAAGRTVTVEMLPDGWNSQPTEDSIYFAQGSAQIDDAADSVVRRHVEHLSSNAKVNVTLVAHTDDLGSPSLDIARGQQRLDAILRRMDESGISRKRIRTINLGSEVVKASPCEDDHCRQLRRRVDFLFHK